MAKFPTPGFVKTRLAKTIGDEGACDLYKAFLADITPRFAPQNGSIHFDVCWVFTPSTDEFKNLINEHYKELNKDNVMFKGFLNPGLAEQQIEAFKWAQTNGYDQSMIITSDSPHILRETVEKAFKDLEDKDMVIGPTLDGGYYLLGIKDNWNVLENVVMSTDHVANDIIKNATKLKKTVSVQEKTTDIDTYKDMQLFKDLLYDFDESFCMNTREELKKIDKFILGFEKVLKEYNFDSSDNICICLPEVRAKNIAIQLCQKLNINISLLDLNNISEESLTNFLNTNKSKGLVIADWTLIDEKPIPTKTIADRASINVPTLENIFVVKNMNKSISWLDGRDVWF